MIYGIPPFYSKNQDTMFKNIQEAQVRFPKNPVTSDECKDLILKVLYY